MTRVSHFLFAAFFAALVGVVGLAPSARAASLPTGAAISLELASKATAEKAQYRRRGYGRRHYRPRHYRSRRGYRPYPVYRRHCWNQRRMVWTPYGYRSHFVRVCR